MLRSMRRGLEMWQGRDAVTLASPKGRETGNTNFDLHTTRQSPTLPKPAMQEPTCYELWEGQRRWMIAQAMKPHQEAVMRLAEVPGFGVDSAQQVIAEVGVKASTFPSAAEFTSWVGTCPGKDESAEENHSSRSAKGNKYLRRLLSQAAHAAVKQNGSHFQAVFRRLLPRLGYQSAIWAIAHRLCRVLWEILHEGVRFIEQGKEPDPQAKKHRARMLARALRRLGYNVAIYLINPPTPQNATPTQ